MNTAQIIDKTVTYVQETLADAEGGHDWWHIYRVWNSAKQIATTENVNLLVVELGALLHDIADSKFYNGNEEIGPQKAADFLRSIQVTPIVIDHIIQIIKNISFKGGKVARTFNSKELDVIQDADRLDAIGAMGIARCFSFGGYKNRAIYNPNIKPNLNMSKEEYKNSTTLSINHFYEKLLLLKNMMNTKTGKQMAQERHDFMALYLNQFYAEWDGTK